MTIRTQSVHFDADAKLLEFIQKKVTKLEHFFDRIISADVIMQLEKTAQVQDKVSEVRLQVPGAVLFAKETCKTFEEGIDLAVESLSRQLAKHKEKQRTHDVIDTDRLAAD